MAWKKRMMARIDRERLVGMLYDAALSGRDTVAKQILLKPKFTDWGRMNLPKSLRKIRNAAYIIFLIVMILKSWSFLVAERPGPGEPPPSLRNIEYGKN